MISVCAKVVFSIIYSCVFKSHPFLFIYNNLSENKQTLKTNIYLHDKSPKTKLVNAFGTLALIPNVGFKYAQQEIQSHIEARDTGSLQLRNPQKRNSAQSNITHVYFLIYLWSLYIALGNHNKYVIIIYSVQPYTWLSSIISPWISPMIFIPNFSIVYSTLLHTKTFMHSLVH